MSDIRRIFASTTVSIPSGSSLSSTYFDMRRVVDGAIEISASFDDANIGFKVSSASDGTPVPLYNDNAEIVEIISPSVSSTFTFPSSLYGVGYVWVWTQTASGTNVDQTSVSTPFTIHLKS